MANGTSTAAQPGGGGAALQRRRLGGTSRKTAAGRSLGAVRLKEARQDEASRVLQDIENIENGVPPPSGNIKPSPLTEVPLATETVANALSPTARFQSELAEHGTTEKWFDEQLTDVKQTGRRSSSGSAGTAPPSRFTPAFANDRRRQRRMLLIPLVRVATTLALFLGIARRRYIFSY